MLHPLNLDARKIVVRANKLIEQLNLSDECGEKGGLLATYTPTEGILVVEDEACAVKWAIPCSHFMSQKDWGDIRCWIFSFSESGCPEDHEHFFPMFD